MTTSTPDETGQPAPEEPTGQDQESPEQGPRSDRPARRTFTAEFKRAIVKEYDSAPNGSKGAILRRERLYDSHIQEWRAAFEAGKLEKPTARRGRPKNSTEQTQIAQLTKELAAERASHERTRDQLASSDAALDTLGKGVAFLEALCSKNASSPAPNTHRGKQRP
ncbi:transposase [Paeniglutamicibacter cryotolerans]|uniref:Transposase-like protein n=1 Tax=Paeniglutamicibacter cryotolerans TaxID=670079 RepID=A0A839QMY9_9MICC|nr:transposase [Paeniglutamicibacter cryotolerans]MBB2994582.1 transposase-like protein [Paeniglutamicibacter cryotolerans]MBB2995663.1 transposase-like protein [Paeniglutamicibacter cryotolerans]